ncbi:MAG: TraR/DksA family transcriptional regulator [Bryobacteraceae bacterium]
MPTNRIASTQPVRSLPPESAVLFHQTLTEKKNSILFALGAKVTTLTRSDRLGEDDQAQHSHEEFISLRLNGMEYSQLRQIQEALDRIQSGDFGLCLSCERPIPPKRLEAIPWAKYCVRCQERHADSVYRETFPLILSEEPAN